MFPLESFEMGVPCLLGNNNDYFVGTKLGEYVILESEDDAEYIKERIEMLKGTVSFDGRDGFTVTARIPIRWGETYD